jgi:hypothetical protein
MCSGVVLAESVELATILLTDLVGSTRLATSVGPVRADQLREEHFELLRDAVASSGGREVKNTGDGLMVAFSSASAAVQCAVAVQRGPHERSTASMSRPPEHSQVLLEGLSSVHSSALAAQLLGGDPPVTVVPGVGTFGLGRVFPDVLRFAVGR